MKLDCWKKAVALRKELSLLVKTFPADEKFRLIDQILRASRSVTANIAEGFGRFHYQEYIQYCRQSRGSRYEIIDHLIVAAEEKYVTEAQLNEIRREVNECLAVLNGFINYLLRAKSGNGIEEPQTIYTLSEVSDTDN
ncbi:MAG TPA: four helix bundle protein [Chryseolinea sp.]|nr:four helix bundle protein [Chryseolinea sp.]